MKRLLTMGIILVSLAGSLQAEVISPNSNVSATCGEKIKKSDVTVLDLEGFGDDIESAKAFVDEHVGLDSIISTTPEVIMTKWQRGWYNRDSSIKAATKEAAKRGCDVLLILSATGGELMQKSSGARVMMGDRGKS